MSGRTCKYVDWSQITSQEPPQKKPRLSRCGIHEPQNGFDRNKLDEDVSQTLVMSEIGNGQACLPADVLSRPRICDDEVMDVVYDIFGSLVNRVGEKYYKIMFENGDTDWVRSDYCPLDLIREYEHFKSRSIVDCGSSHECALDGHLCQRHIDEALSCMTCE